MQINETINPYYARVPFPNGRMNTVSTSDLAPASSESPEMVNKTVGENLNQCSDDAQEVDASKEQENKVLRPIRNRKAPQRYIEQF